MENRDRIQRHLARSMELLSSFGADDMVFRFVRKRDNVHEGMDVLFNGRVADRGESDHDSIFIGKVVRWLSTCRKFECEKLYAWPEGSRVYISLHDSGEMCVMNGVDEFDEPDEKCTWSILKKDGKKMVRQDNESVMRFLNRRIDYEQNIETQDIEEDDTGDREFLLENERHIMTSETLNLYDESKYLHKQQKRERKDSVPNMKICNLSYFGKQTHEQNCWIFSMFGLIIKFLYNDVTLHEKFPALEKIKRKLYNKQQLLVNDIMKTERVSRFGKLWQVYGEVMKHTHKYWYENNNKKYRDYFNYEILAMTEGGFAERLFLSYVLMAGYEVYFLFYGKDNAMKFRLDDEKLHVSEQFVTAKRSKNDYIIAQVTYGTDEIDRIKKNLEYIGEIFEMDMKKFKERGLLHRLVGGFFSEDYKEGGAHVIMFSVCRGAVVLCDSQKGQCDDTAIIYGDFIQKSKYIGIYYIFAPEHIKLDHQFSKEETRKMRRFRTKYDNDFHIDNDVPIRNLECPFDAYYNGNVVQVIKKIDTECEIKDAAGMHDKIKNELLRPVPYEDSLYNDISLSYIDIDLRYHK